MAEEQGEQELYEAVRKSLEDAGAMGHFKAEVRSAVLSILNKTSGITAPPDLPEETKFINDLIREYLLWNGYVYSEKVLGVESGLQGGYTDRKTMATKLGVADETKTSKIPLLYYMLSDFKRQ